MYEFIFQSKLVTAASGVLLLVLACALTARVGFWWRVAALNLGPVISAGFIAAILLSDERFSTIDVIAALVFVFTILCIFCWIVFHAYLSLHELSGGAASRLLLITALIYTASYLPTMLSGGFGIFSTGTRIDYLYESSSAKYLTYAGLMVSVVMSGLIARRVTLHRKPRLLDYIVILIVSAASILAGSKGGFVLWIGTILAFIDYRKAQIRSRTIALAAVGMGALVTVLAVVVSEFLRLTVPEFIDLAFSRFFLGNDANALAFEARNLAVDPAVSLVSEMFRSISSLFGYPPKNAPLGVELYDSYFGPQGGAGANSSLLAIVIYYTVPGSAILPLLISSLAALVAIPVLRFLRRIYHIPSNWYTIEIIMSLNVVLYAQDFLAFQVIAPMTVVLACALYISEHLHISTRIMKVHPR